jgi:predicted dehydrogenase
MNATLIAEPTLNGMSQYAMAPASDATPIRKRYAIVGLGARARMFTDAIAGEFQENAELMGLCDISPTRLAWHNERLREEHHHAPVATYDAADFETMLVQQRVDTVIVTTMDALHHEYIIRSLKAGCDCIVEKPLTIDAEKARAIQDTVRATGRDLQVTFNMRYQPITTKVRELIASGVIGKPLAVNLNYVLDTRHGADYFRRWHRDKSNSGGLLVHKSTHHFDMVNWLIDSTPSEVFAFGDVKFYGKPAANARGEHYEYERYTGSAQSANDPFALRLDDSEYTRTLYLDAEKESGYVRDKNVFGEGVTSEDTMGVLARYENGVILNYSLIAYAPQEGYELYITGNKGRIEIRMQRPPHVLDENFQSDMEPEGRTTVRVLPMFREPYEVEVPRIEGGHGGGDTLMLRDLFGANEKAPDPFGRHATLRDGLASLAIGVAANASIATGKPVRVRDHFSLD